jgi:hypothetical protein
MSMASETFMAVIPFYGDVSRLNRGDLAMIGLIAVEANAASNFEGLGFCWSHSVGRPKTSRREFDLSVW